MGEKAKKIARVRIVGPDRKGIIATITSFLYQNSINIEDIDQRILEDTLIMNMVVDLKGLKKPLAQLERELKKAGQSVHTEASLTLDKEKPVKNIALLVTKEPHCLMDLIHTIHKKNKAGTIKVIIGNQGSLRGIAQKYKIPFFHFPSKVKKEHETKIIKKLQEYDIDLIVLARYMQILSPDFCFRFEGRIINIHPSLLPAFPGAMSYVQAYNKGVEIVGVTAHFVTTDLDEGPIICQDGFRVNPSKISVEAMTQKGRLCEAKVLTKAVKMFIQDELVLRRGKVVHNKRERRISQKAKEFYKN
jgi:formyltetrahydrofolate deformylase